MNINKIKDSVKILLEQDEQTITPFIMGIPGVGKSQIIQQIKDELKFDHLIDLRMSQHDDTDVKGIPVNNDGIFTWCQPDFIPVIGNKKYEGTSGILFLDEINRASQETLQSVFELVLDYKVGGKELLPNWYVVCAGNYGFEDGTNVTEMDSALKNRFAFFFITKDDITISEWIDNFANKNGINKHIIDFLNINPRFLYYEKNEGSLITPRSWEKLSTLMNKNKERIMDILDNIAGGIVYQASTPLLQHYSEYLENSKKISPDELINGDKTTQYIENIERAELYRIMSEVNNYIATLTRTNKKQLKNFKILFEALDSDQKVAVLKQGINDKGVNKFITNFLKENDKEYNQKDSEMYRIICEAL